MGVKSCPGTLFSKHFTAGREDVKSIWFCINWISSQECSQDDFDACNECLRLEHTDNQVDRGLAFAQADSVGGQCQHACANRQACTCVVNDDLKDCFLQCQQDCAFGCPMCLSSRTC